MRLLTSLLIVAMVGFVVFACQESTIVPREYDSPQAQARSARSTPDAPIAPVAASTDYVLYGVSSGGDALSILDPETGVSTLVGRLDPDPKIFATPVAMAVRACDGGIFVWNNSNLGEEPNTTILDGRLLTVDPCTGLGSAVNAALEHQGILGAIAFHPDGRLFGTDASLVEIDPTSGQVTSVGTIGVRIGGADFHPATGVLYGVELGGSYRFGTIDIETAEFTEIGSLDLAEGVTGTIAFDVSGNTLYGTSMYATGQLFEIDIETAAISNIVPIAGITPQGMGFAPACGQGGGDCGLPETKELTLVIKPGGCPNPLNLRSRGVLPMALLGGENTGVGDIDVSSIEINGVLPLRSGIEDIGGPVAETAENCECAEGDYDGYLDLMLKFSSQAIVASLGPVARGDVVELTMTGMLLDGTGFEANECVVIVGK